MGLKDYIIEVRPKLTVFFIYVILGVLYSQNFDFYTLDYKRLFLIFISFQITYSAIYVLNDIVDYKKDKLNPRKRYRPISSGKITRKDAFIFAIILIIIGIIIGLFVSMTLIIFELFFLIYSFVYTTILKKIPYIDTLSGSFTHILRFIMGLVLFGTFNLYYMTASLFILDICWILTKRIKESNHKETVSHPLKFYSIKIIRLFWIFSFIALIILFLISNGSEKIGILIILFIYIITIIGYSKNNKIKDLMEKFAD